MASYCCWHRIARQTQHKLVLPFKHASCKCSRFTGNRNTILNGTIPNKPSTSTNISFLYGSMDKMYPITSILPQFFIFFLFTAKHYTQYLNQLTSLILVICKIRMLGLYDFKNFIMFYVWIHQFKWHQKDVSFMTEHLLSTEETTRWQFYSRRRGNILNGNIFYYKVFWNSNNTLCLTSFGHYPTPWNSFFENWVCYVSGRKGGNSWPTGGD